MATQSCEYTKKRWNIHFKRAHCMVGKLHLNKAVFLKKKNTNHYRPCLDPDINKV